MTTWPPCSTGCAAFPAGFAVGGESEYARALYLNPDKAEITAARFADYDAEIANVKPPAEHDRRAWKGMEAPSISCPAVRRTLSAPLFRRRRDVARRVERREEERPADAGHAGLHGRGFAHHRRAERHRLRQDPRHARPYLAIPAPSARRWRTAQQRHPGDAERTDVGAARTRTAVE